MQASNITKTTTNVAKEIRSTMHGETKPVYTEAEKNVFSLNAMINGRTCEACS